ncbi:ATP-binding protein [Iningainema tapete]|uniref:histidine kinase n=1 Tax=Iningainema tapete BLCC-T55 TaxID=2748662 RepID=A0A8J7C985_9CYAN|nr:ATP-binding protein [Iningainema tapete]MBD2775651.1 GAF domain-containing protein [Iningainema tapete BLCC-T55]
MKDEEKTKEQLIQELAALRHSRSLLETVVLEQQHAQEALRQQTQQQQLVAEIAQRIRQSLNLEEVLNTTVSEVQQFLSAQRVFIYRFQPDWSGVAIIESVDCGWSSIQGQKITDTFFADPLRRELYQKGRIQAIEDIYTAGLSPCHVNLLAQLQVRANLVVPIIQGEQLWGLLVANQCSQPRKWQQLEIDLLEQLATQLAIALQQSMLFAQLQIELTERKQAEEKIREQAALLDIATDAIVVRDLENKILFWNKSAERIYGYSSEEALGKDAAELLYKDTSAKLTEALHQVKHIGCWCGELTKVDKNGTEVIIESRWTLVRDEQGNPKSILTVGTDITQKKQLEAQFLRAQRLESLGTLAGGIAHDLNNILAPMLMSAQLLQMRITEKQNQQLLQTIVTNAQRGAALVKQVLSFTRGVETKRAILQLRHLILEIEQFAKQTFPKSIELRQDIAPDLWTVFGDATQLHQVLMNLVINARDAMPYGGVLSIRAENFFVDETYARMNIEATVGPYIVITIKDTGIGMPPEILDRIFEPFFTTKEVGKGTGLGLSTVLGIVKSHGGFINVTSTVEQGTQFQVFLKAVLENQKQPTKNLELPAGNGELILVVDDEAEIRTITKIMLETYNYKVITASDGIEAMALYAQHRNEISVVLIDIMMPTMDGLTTIRALQKMNPLVKIIASSGIEENKHLTQASGVKTFLSKPYTVKQLLQTIQTILIVNC